MKPILAIAALSVLLPLPASGQDETTTDAPTDSPPPCTADEYRQFDFWVGEWSVAQADGSIAGENSIQPILNGCVLLERWQGNSGFVGNSFNAWDAAEGVWRQTWVDGSGGRLDLTGGLDGDDMVLSGERPGREGGIVKHEIRWTPQEDGTVKQHWRASKDDGDTWGDLFVGTYTRK